ncbi:DEAD/DEAH box helicase [Paenibacillus spiritus]|uniref:DNA 3'-5' helicase n=1 Tax=Paenibacillus spiritus TaxID=2496557 RepID=A0A5J5G8V4_9BACL|nr:DNA repair helicase XPB [Paenibacillus spiritus]KAA9004042.1 DEAD/DEAH box helicase [Paenibacillus spiritus]
MNGNGPLIVRKDRTLLLDCSHSRSAEAGEKLAQFAELVKSPPPYHTYRMSSLSLWNAAARGLSAEQTVEWLREYARWDPPEGVAEEVTEIMSRYGKLRLLLSPASADRLVLTGEIHLLDELERKGASQEAGLRRTGPCELTAELGNRGRVKQALARAGYPVLDEAGYRAGEALAISWKPGRASELRDYQKEAAERYRSARGSGVLVLPCGAGKTLLGIAVLQALSCEALILTSSTTSVRQWIAELFRWTELEPADVGEYSGSRRQIRPVTVATYQMLARKGEREGRNHLGLLGERSWGLIVYDEVHLLPAPVFRVTADLQATRRLGLTATLVREDGRESDVFSLIGPKLYDCPWKKLEGQGWLAEAACTEIRVPMAPELRMQYLRAPVRDKFRLASVNPAKTEAALRLLKRHAGEPVLIIGQYLDQLEEIAAAAGIPLLTGRTPQGRRMELYRSFNAGEIPGLAVSKVANFAVDLPAAAVAIEVSGAYGSRQEEAQRLGRILRPKPGRNRAIFYVLVTEDTREEDFAVRRRLFLTEQGYEYRRIGLGLFGDGQEGEYRC